MLGRTANDLYWQSRYVERAENIARLVEVGYRIVLLPRSDKDFHQEWRSTLESAGCLSGYLAKHGVFDTRNVIDYMLFDLENPSSVAACLHAARSNARAQRTAITRDMWESLNDSWLHMSKLRPSSMTSDALPDFLDWVRSRSALYRGALLNTILRNDTFYFSQLGTFIERADSTARILDVKYYHLLPSSHLVGTSPDNAQWASILRSVSAHRSYRWVYKDTYRPWNIAEYLILNRQMPRSLRACYDEMASALNDLALYYGQRHACHATVASTRDRLIEIDVDTIFQSGLHEFVQDLIGRNNALGLEISAAYHFND
ncbi:MAG: alpha-E domain-containing protein [Hyphomicrobiaceae bacterium]|nr:alpha-E domain-containing protein [Hyphomicrobiaceae bacterium]